MVVPVQSMCVYVWCLLKWKGDQIDLASPAQCREEERGKGVCVSICLSWWVYSELEGVLGCVTPGVPVNLRVIPPLCPAGLVLVLKHHNGKDPVWSSPEPGRVST